MSIKREHKRNISHPWQIDAHRGNTERHWIREVAFEYIWNITDSTFTQSENDPTSLTSGKHTENSPSHNLRTILRHRAVGNVQQTSGSTETS